MTRLVEHYGGIWRLSEISYTRLLRKIATSEEWDLNGMGTFLGQIDNHLTDLTSEEAKTELSTIKEQSSIRVRLRGRRNLHVVR